MITRHGSCRRIVIASAPSSRRFLRYICLRFRDVLAICRLITSKTLCSLRRQYPPWWPISSSRAGIATSPSQLIRQCPRPRSRVSSEVAAPPRKIVSLRVPRVRVHMASIYVLSLGMCWLSASVEAADRDIQHGFGRLVGSLSSCKSSSRTEELACIIEQVWRTATLSCLAMRFCSRCRKWQTCSLSRNAPLAATWAGGLLLSPLSCMSLKTSLRSFDVRLNNALHNFCDRRRDLLHSRPPAIVPDTVLKSAGASTFKQTGSRHLLSSGGCSDVETKAWCAQYIGAVGCAHPVVKRQCPSSCNACPTEPTLAPTRQPSHQPTGSPTKKPTRLPTRSPTTYPTAKFQDVPDTPELLRRCNMTAVTVVETSFVSWARQLQGCKYL